MTKGLEVEVCERLSAKPAPPLRGSDESSVTNLGKCFYRNLMKSIWGDGRKLGKRMEERSNEPSRRPDSTCVMI